MYYCRNQLNLRRGAIGILILFILTTQTAWHLARPNLSDCLASCLSLPLRLLYLLPVLTTQTAWSLALLGSSFGVFAGLPQDLTASVREGHLKLPWGAIALIIRELIFLMYYSTTVGYFLISRVAISIIIVSKYIIIIIIIQYNNCSAFQLFLKNTTVYFFFTL